MGRPHRSQKLRWRVTRARRAMGAVAATLREVRYVLGMVEKLPHEDAVKDLKNLSEALERLRTRRKEIKTQLSKELREEDEFDLVEEMYEASKAIKKLEEKRRTMIKDCQ
jgi:ABC-type phosphate transport system auxiliary subunit